MTRPGNERGSVTLEAVILIPAFLLFVALVIAGGRVAMARQGVQTAAALLGMQDDLSNAELDELEKMIAKARDGRDS